MYYFFRSWRDSLSLFLPKNAKLFFLVTLKTIIESYKIILRDLWWLFALSFGLELIYSRYFPQNIIFCLAALLSWFITIFIMYLIIRPSMKRKEWEYYNDYWRYFFCFICFSVLAYIIPYGLLYFGSKIAIWTQKVHMLFYLILVPFLLIPLLLSFLVHPALLSIYASPLLAFVILFFLDTPGMVKDAFKSMARGFKMILYNYPFCFLIFLLFFAGSLLSQWIVLHFFGPCSVAAHLISPISNLLLPIPLSILTNFYTKRTHEQYGLYYPETIKE